MGTSLVFVAVLAANAVGYDIGDQQIAEQNQIFKKWWGSEMVWRFDDLPTESGVTESVVVGTDSAQSLFVAYYTDQHRPCEDKRNHEKWNRRVPHHRVCHAPEPEPADARMPVRRDEDHVRLHLIRIPSEFPGHAPTFE